MRKVAREAIVEAIINHLIEADRFNQEGVLFDHVIEVHHVLNWNNVQFLRLHNRSYEVTTITLTMRSAVRVLATDATLLEIADEDIVGTERTMQT